MTVCVNKFLNLLQMSSVDYLEKVHLGKLLTAKTWNGKTKLLSLTDDSIPVLSVNFQCKMMVSTGFLEILND